MTSANWTDVRFDYEGALALARSLWELGDDIDEAASDRMGRAELALTSWQGAFQKDFIERVNQEFETAAQLALGLRQDAQGWAYCWWQAMTEQNNRLHARKEEQVRDDRSNWDKVTGFFTGHDDLPDPPAQLAVPSPPSFAATGGFVSY